MQRSSGAGVAPALPRPAGWRGLLLAGLAVVSLAAMLGRPPVPQNQAYHGFADTRTWLGIPQAGDVLTNLVFLVPGWLGLLLCGRNPAPAGARRAWQALFTGSALVTFGSGYYHWRPEDWTLRWDRLPRRVIPLQWWIPKRLFGNLISVFSYLKDFRSQ